MRVRYAKAEAWAQGKRGSEAGHRAIEHTEGRESAEIETERNDYCYGIQMQETEGESTSAYYNTGRRTAMRMKQKS